MPDFTTKYQIKTFLPGIAMIVAFVYCLFMFGKCQQSEFHCILIYGLSSFIIYITFLLKKPKLTFVFLAGLLARTALVHVFPGLSDDIFRFIWDGRLTASSMNPYSYLPTEVVAQQIQCLDDKLFLKLNSPNYYTIYPPVSQFVFWISTWFGTELMSSSVAMKLMFLVAEISTFFGIIKVLDFLERPRSYSAVYWLNPLIIIEGVGNLHFEILMISFLIWGVYFLFVNNNIKIGALLFSLSIAVKLLPLILLPFIFFRFPTIERFEFFKYLIGFCLVLFTPIFFGIELLNFGSSIDLYFQKFEFNASFYYIFRHIGELLSGYNLIYYIGPLLALLTLTLVIRAARKHSEIEAKPFLQFSLIAFTTYLFLATTIHPWYLCLPILFAVFTRSVYIVAWSALILLTYINYSFEEFNENLWIVTLEYGVVFTILICEYVHHVTTYGKSME